MTPPPRPSRELVATLAARAQAITAEAHDLLAGAMCAAVDAPGGLSGMGAEAVGDVVQYLARGGRSWSSRRCSAPAPGAGSSARGWPRSTSARATPRTGR